MEAPIIYDESFTAEFERHSYAPPITPHPVAFSNDGRAYVRQGHGVAYEADGEWRRAEFGKSVDMFMRNDLRIVFDRDGYGYTPVLTTAGKGYLMVKPPNSEQWQAHDLPDGDIRMEWFSGARQLAGPPAMMLFRDKTISLVAVVRDGSVVRLSEPKQVADNVLAIARLGSGGSVVVRSGLWINAVYAATDGGEAGTREMIVRWSPELNQVDGPHCLGTASIYQATPDSHDVPVVVSDSRGELHAVLGAHNRVFKYTRTINGAWTQPVAVRNSANEAWNLSYPELVCDGKDTLHLVARRWTREQGQFLVYLHKRVGQEWSSPRELVVPAHGGYFNAYHRLMKDASGKLYLTWYAYFDHFTDSQAAAYQQRFPNEKLKQGSDQGFGRFSYEGVKRHGPYLLINDGESWKLWPNSIYSMQMSLLEANP